MKRKQIGVYLITVGLSLLLPGILMLPLGAWAAPLAPPVALPIAQSAQITTTPSITLTPTMTVTTPISESFLTATSTLTPTATSTVTPTPTPTSQVTPTKAPAPTDASEPKPPIASPTPEPGGLGDWFLQHPVLFAGIMVGFLGLLFLGLLLVWFFRRKRRRPKRTGTRPITPLKPSAPPTAPAPASLTYTDTEGQVRTYELNPEGVTIGRATDNGLVIGPTFPNWETVSQHHARISRKGEDWIVTDLNSANGIYVNAQRTGRNLLHDGWKLALGAVIFTFRAGKGG
ncbi:MAG: FHA domain-containing protein [Anaerolineae bacterium]|nr:FHA domain-containing protein [Anaerolineae bacterium]